MSQDITVSEKKKKRKFKLNFPSAFTILFILTIIAALATWFVPAGEYAKISYNKTDKVLVVHEPSGETVTYPPTQASLDKLGVQIKIDQFTSGSLYKPISVPNTYQKLKSNPRGVYDIFVSMVEGTIQASDIMVFIFVLGGLIGVVDATGAFESGLMQLTKKTKGHEFALVFLVSLLMALGGTTCGLEEEAVAFYPIIVPVFIALGYDSIVCVGAVFLAGSMGTTMSTINPFSAVIASNAAGISFMEGMNWRILGLVIGFIFVILYLKWYCNKISKNPEFSYTWDDRVKFREMFSVKSDTTKNLDFTFRKKITLVLFVCAFVGMVIGVMNLGWGFAQMAALFLCISIIVMGLSGLPEKVSVDAFIKGSSSLVGVSLIIGLARGINLILAEGMIADTLLYWSSQAVQGLPAPIFVILLQIIFFGLGFIVPSSSGLAVLSMPILAPLADTVGLPRFVVECAFQFGQYAMLYIAPTGLILATLQMLDMKYKDWLRFAIPVVIFVLGLGSVILVAQALMYA